MTARDIRDRVAEALYINRAWGLPRWINLPNDYHGVWRAEADKIIADLAAVGLAIVEKDAPHD